MKNSIGTSVILTLAGESHGSEICAVLDGLAPGIPVDEAFLAAQLARRRPAGVTDTARREADAYRIVSGVKEGLTTGSPLCILIPNADVRSADYEALQELARPSHADWAASAKYGGFEDRSGGGHFSGRITVGIVAAGAIGGAGYFGYRSLVKTKDKTPETSISQESTEETDEQKGSSEETKNSKKTINVLGMTPDQLDLTGGYVRTGTYHNYSDNTDKAEHQQYYNSDGLLVLECDFDEDDVVIYSDYYIYDQDGRVTREEHWDASNNTSGVYKEYTYGAFGVERMDSGYFEKEPEKYSEYEYDSQGRLIKVTEYQITSGNSYWYCDYEYADDGTYITRITSWDISKQKMVQSKDYCRYSSDGKILEEYRDFQAERYNYSYDNRGNLILEEHYYGKKLNSSTTYEYDANDRLLLEKTVSDSGKDWWDYTYEYKDL